MYKYLLGNNPKKSPGLPFIKMSLKNNKMNNISKRMNKSLIYLSKETELLVLGNNNLSEKQEKKNLNKTTVDTQNTKEDIEIFYFKNKNKKKEDTKKSNEKSIKKINNTKLISSTDYLKQKLNKIMLREKNKNKNKNKLTNIYSMNSNSTILNNLNMKHYYSTNTYRKSENTSEKNTTKNYLSKNKNEESYSERSLFSRILSSKKIKKSTYRNISRLSSLLNDTSKKYIMLNMKLKNYSQENSFKNIKKSFYDKSLQPSKSQENMDSQKINLRKIFDNNDNILNKPLKQIKDVRKNRMIWIKKSTANLLAFGKVSQLMKDEQFYKERKRIIGSYLKYEKEADLYIKKKESEKNSFRNEQGIKNMRKIDELLAQNHELLKNILNQGEDKKE